MSNVVWKDVSMTHDSSMELETCSTLEHANGVDNPDSNSNVNAPAYYKNVLQKAGVATNNSATITDNNLAAANECECSSPNYNIASNSRGCLKCTSEDCSYYIQNIVETFLFDYNISIYQCTK